MQNGKAKGIVELVSRNSEHLGQQCVAKGFSSLLREISESAAISIESISWSF